jgi:hypothetical protein
MGAQSRVHGIDERAIERRDQQRPRRLNPRREALLPVIKRRARRTIIRVAINYIVEADEPGIPG